MVLLLRVDHLFSFERLDSLSSLFFENRILNNMIFLLLLRVRTISNRSDEQGQLIYIDLDRNETQLLDKPN